MVDSFEKVYEVEADEGELVMNAGLKFGVPFEMACGGNAECTTCHIKLPDAIMESGEYEEATDFE